MTSRLALIGLLLVACARTTAGPAGPTAVTTDPPPAPSATGSPIQVAVTDSTYGRIAIRTLAGTRCSVSIHIGPPEYGDLPPTSVEGTADAGGGLTLTYPAPHLPGGTGRHEVSCGTGTASADFPIPTSIAASRFSVRIRVPAITEQIPGATARPEASLVPPRDLDVAALKGSLVSEWTKATRGLSTLDLVSTATADMVITILPARGTSVHVSAGDGSQAIFLYVSDGSGVFTSDNLVAVTLHELGHIWCCHGPDASTDGHWAQAITDPLLQGVDAFGLMNHPVKCTFFAGGIESCPNRFSDRELRTMGFTQIPPPPRNVCVDTKNTLLAQLATTKDRLASQKAAIDVMDTSLATLSAQIRGLEAKYPNGMPPDVYASYTALVDRYNAGVATERSAVASYNALITQSNDLADQVNRLLC